MINSELRLKGVFGRTGRVHLDTPLTLNGKLLALSLSLSLSTSSYLHESLAFNGTYASSVTNVELRNPLSVERLVICNTVCCFWPCIAMRHSTRQRTSEK